MASFFRCQNCGFEMDSTTAMAAFEENPHCRQCGLSLSESDSKMQDDLVNMMTRHLQLNPSQQAHNVSMPTTPQAPVMPTPITYITQHYHHSSHQVPVESTISSVLENAGINASVLLPSQLMLFRNAQPDQQARLIELWRIAPPTPGTQLPSGNTTNWPGTSLEQEELAAHQRWQATEQERLKNLSALPVQESRSTAEPYITNGYSHLSNINGITAPTEYGSTHQTSPNHKTSTDPAYNSREWWHMSAGEQPVEHQYGLLQHMMYSNDQISRHQEDEEML